nr:MAG TPA: hypothetical protein [Bacteriophage sp.]
MRQNLINLSRRRFDKSRRLSFFQNIWRLY